MTRRLGGEFEEVVVGARLVPSLGPPRGERVGQAPPPPPATRTPWLQAASRRVRQRRCPRGGLAAPPARRPCARLAPTAHTVDRRPGWRMASCRPTWSSCRPSTLSTFASSADSTPGRARCSRAGQRRPCPPSHRASGRRSPQAARACGGKLMSRSAPHPPPCPRGSRGLPACLSKGRGRGSRGRSIRRQLAPARQQAARTFRCAHA